MSEGEAAAVRMADRVEAVVAGILVEGELVVEVREEDILVAGEERREGVVAGIIEQVRVERKENKSQRQLAVAAFFYLDASSDDT